MLRFKRNAGTSEERGHDMPLATEAVASNLDRAVTEDAAQEADHDMPLASNLDRAVTEDAVKEADHDMPLASNLDRAVTEEEADHDMPLAAGAVATMTRRTLV
jgi:hypothetical protein